MRPQLTAPPCRLQPPRTRCADAAQQQGISQFLGDTERQVELQQVGLQGVARRASPPAWLCMLQPSPLLLPHTEALT